MIEVFVRTMAQTNLRAALAWAVLERWAMEPDIRLRIIAGAPAAGAVEISRHFGSLVEVVLPAENFHWSSRKYAEENSTGSPYVLADDDRLLLGADWVKRALKLWERASAEGFALLSDNSCIEAERQWPKGFEPRARGWAACPEYFDAPHQAGANYFAKKGAVDYCKFTAPANRQDEEVADYLRAKGLRLGFMRDVISTHLAYGFSQAQPLLWNRY
jgi:hypothetical protein